MNPAQLLAHFDRIGEAPEAVPRLRRFILDLAVRGKLVEQDPRDEPASDLLKRIQLEKSHLVKEGKIGKQEPFAPIVKSEIPFQIPKTWEWVPATFPAYLLSDMGKKVQTKDVLESGGFPVVDQGKVFIRGYCNDANKVIHIGAPIILFGDHTRETKLINFDFVVGADGVKLLHPVCILTDYYYLALKWLPLDSRGYGRHFKLLRAATLPLPPLAEQHRIVAKVDELMTLCDRLEKAQTERESRRDRLVASSLNGLSNGADAEAFREHARFYFNHLPRLTTRPNHIKQLRQTILNLAVRGKLVPQDPNDEPAIVLLEKIAKEKEHLVKEGKIAKTKPLPEITENEKPFELAQGWEWTRPENFSQKITDGEHFRPPTQDEGVYFLSAKDIRAEGISLNDPLYISVETAEKALERCNPEKGDVLIVSRGATVGRMCTVDIEDVFCLLGSVILIKPVQPMLSDYLKVVMKTPQAFGQLVTASGSTAQPAIYLRDIKKIVFPIAPLAEQHRIVAKVDELMALCHQLETQLTTTQSEARHLLEAILLEALNPTLEKIA